MMLRMYRVLAGLLLLVLLIGLCWLFAIYQGWPWWSALLLCVVVLAGGAVLCWGWRRWRNWRLKRRLARDMQPAGIRVDHAAFDRQWQAGLAVLRQARHAGLSSSARRLPWILSLDLHDIPSKAFAGLAVKSLAGQSDASAGAVTPGWYFLRHSVMLHAGHEMVMQGADQPDSSWRRLLYSLNRLRRQEPLNGVVLRVDTARLMQDGELALAELGRSVRVRLDELARVMDARMPVWLVMTGAQALPGLQAWAMALEDGVRHAALGTTLTPEQREQAISARVRQLFADMNLRLFELRVAQGLHGPLPADVFEFPLQVLKLEEPVQRMLAPAFDASPYAPAPLLQGVYLTAQGSEQQQWVPWFSQALYDTILPAQRDAWVPLDRWRQSRRLARRTVVVAWLAVCALCAFGLFHSWRHVGKEIAQLEARPLEGLNFDDGLESDLQSLHVWRDATAQLLRAEQGWQNRLPLMGYLAQLHDGYRQQFAQLYRQEILGDSLDPLLTEILPDVTQRGHDIELAAWAQYLTRRINLIQARLDGRPLAGMPLPGAELREIFLAAGRPAPGAQAAILTGQLYRDYLLWQPQMALLRSEQDSLRAALLQLGLSARSPTWLLAWADLQGDLRPITLSDFWMIPYDPFAPQIPAGLTPDGTHAIQRFVDEMAQAMPQDGAAWQSRREELERRFRQASFDAWYRFADSFPDARGQLPNEEAWRSQVARTMTLQDPYVSVMRHITTLFDGMPQQDRPDWVSHVIELSRLLQATQTGADADSQGGLLERARMAGTLGGAQLRNLTAGASFEQSASQLERSLDTVGDMRLYRQDVMQAAQQSLMGVAGAVQLASETWNFGHDPSVQAGPLLRAQQALDLLQQRLGSDEVGDSVVWDLMQGPLLLTLDYVAKATACQLQSRWENDVLGAVQGVASASLVDDLLYGERGQVPAFLQGDVRYFIDRDTVRYRPRQALGMTVPLNGQFYAFASLAQQQQVRRMQVGQQQAVDQKRQQVDLQTLQEQVADLEKQQAQMRATVARVRLTGEPPLVNPGARLLPQQVRLTLQCADGPVSIENFNFPVSRTFAWSAQSCGDTVLEIRFPDLTLSRTYAGPYGFADFLAEFADGRHGFSPDDFPEQAARLRAQGLEQLTVRWQLQDAQSVQSLADGLRQAAGQMVEHQATIRSVREQEVQQAQQVLTRAADPGAVPARITGVCWQPVAASVLYADVPAASTPGQGDMAQSSSGSAAQPAGQEAAQPGWLVQVGVFAATERARGILQTLGIPHYQEELPAEGGRSMFRLMAGPFDGREQAQAMVARIDRALALRTRIVRR
ncbi:type VI secretion protein IcmF/TssM N-terminal domain-containing protein [Corticimicrobacter populi]|uniref:SPOR domain-containing protein n=1 Tax=Corticimicrobacter populi TaxID=2175229 RepID=A0A2V1K0L6_9BURK|nr:type VI secretion protein IcmF/TssM N-terminal domain-containing protein [Corticimicrobacter populi]PWF24804.1 hypothetical protein DD235_01030 [Corticimicrobacter populi]